MTRLRRDYLFLWLCLPALLCCMALLLPLLPLRPELDALPWPDDWAL